MRLACLLSTLIFAACGGPGVGPEAPGERVLVEGRVTYDARSPTPQGASQALEVRPARLVELTLLDGAGVERGRGRTDADGRFSLEGPADLSGVRVFAHVEADGHDVMIATDGLGREPHAFEVAVDEVTGAPLAVHAGERDGGGPAGAFHMLDTMLTGLMATRGWSGETLPPLFAYWVRGGTRNWSFYRGERPPGSGRFALELLGGDPGQQSISDTDEHDEAIILHELGHFVMDRLSTNSSTGGTHPTGVRVDPGLAWEEGRASWFALAVLRDPRYVDTIGLEPWGSLRVDEDVENAPSDALRGVGSETTVSRVLWDLADGVDGLPDTDDDGLAVGPAAVLTAMQELREADGAYPCLRTFLRHIVDSGRVGEAALRRYLRAQGEPDAMLPAAGTVPWPRTLLLGEVTGGEVDSRSRPSPAGGPNLPGTGLTGGQTYRIAVEETGLLTVRLDIDGSGRIADHTDLDLELRDTRSRTLAQSATEAPTETLLHLVTPGVYIVKVRDGGRPNRASYRLTATLEPA